MTKLKLAQLQEDKPVKLTVTLSAALHRNPVVYADILSSRSGKAVEPAKLIAPMLEKFIASDREFAKARGKKGTNESVSGEPITRPPATFVAPAQK